MRLSSAVQLLYQMGDALMRNIHASSSLDFTIVARHRDIPTALLNVPHDHGLEHIFFNELLR